MGLQGESVLCYDIETKTFGKPDPEKDEFRLFGCYSYKYGRPWILTDKIQVQQMIDKHKFLVGFNNVGTRTKPGYDNKVLERAGISFKYKRFLDLRSLFLQRAGVMKISKGMLGDLLMKYSLDYITRMLGIIDDSTAKGDIDYRVFMKDVWSKEERNKIIKYTRRDIEVTKKLYEWVENYFEGFKPFLKEEDVKKKEYLTASTAKFTYKAICKAMKWQEKYDTEAPKESRIGGGYVAFPAGERFEGDIFLLDYASLYPHIMIMCNIYGRRKELDNERPVWNGNNVWKTEGSYYADKMGGVGELLKQWYNDRVIFKKAKDKREYTLKIILNTSYGILDNAYYANVYDKVASGDVTRIGRQWIQYARKIFREAGYINCFTDTDSIGIHDIFKDKEKVLLTAKKVEDGIKATVPFPSDSFKFKIDDEIKYMFFFKGGNVEKEYPSNEFFEDEDDFVNKAKGLMKKNYIYVTKDDRVIIKNLGLKKKDRSPLGKKIFWEHLVPKIKKGKIRFTKSYIKQLINDLLSKNINLAVMRRDVGNVEQYKNTTNIQAQISKKYGPGLHFLIPNTRGIGVGKGKSFCTMEEFKQHKLGINDIDLDNVWRELDYFITPLYVKNIFDFGKKSNEEST